MEYPAGKNTGRTSWGEEENVKYSMLHFMRDNRFKTMTIMAYLYSFYFWVQIKLVSSSRLRDGWGEEGGESPEEEGRESYKYAASVSRIVNRICTKTPWESKCLVRALTAQKLLKRRGIHSTMYLGCGIEQGKMVAHAWLRCGRMYVTGGDGTGYSVVDRFCC